MSTEGERTRDVAYVEELVDRALGRPAAPGFGPTDDAPAARAGQAARGLVPTRLKLFVLRVVARVTRPVVREEVGAQLESFHHTNNALRAGLASLEVVVDDLRDAVERLEAEQAERRGDSAA